MSKSDLPDPAVGANQVVAADVRVDALGVRVDTLERTAEALTNQAIVTDARVDQLATQTEAHAAEQIVAADRQTALGADSARMLVAMETRLEIAAGNQHTLLEDLAHKEATAGARVDKLETQTEEDRVAAADLGNKMEARLEKIERQTQLIAEVMGAIAATPSIANEIELFIPQLPRTH